MIRGARGVLLVQLVKDRKLEFKVFPAKTNDEVYRLLQTFVAYPTFFQRAVKAL